VTRDLDEPPPDEDAETTAELPLDGTLDLHTFRPAEVKEVVGEYLLACAEAGIHDLRIVHGKGTGVLRKIVEGVLSRSPLVASFRPGDEAAGGWGATLVTLKRDAG
jgi:DNA-nicking Smr family endonuclease